METETTLPADDLEDEEYEEWGPYSIQMHDAMAPIIRKFLVDFFGMQMYNLEPDTYREIGVIIKREFTFDDRIANDINNYCTIKDDGLWEETFNNFDRKDAKFSWQIMSHWSDIVYDNEEDEEFSEDFPESKLTEEQIKAIDEIEWTDKANDYYIQFSSFVKQGCDVLVPAMQKYMEDIAAFDLTILLPEGYEELQNDLEGIADNLFNHLYLMIRKEA